jgi:hypothetical protein
MAKPKREKKTAAAAPPTRVLPMELRIGDRLVDETGEWEVVGRPYTTAGARTRAFASSESASPLSPIYGPGARTSAST